MPDDIFSTQESKDTPAPPVSPPPTPQSISKVAPAQVQDIFDDTEPVSESSDAVNVVETSHVYNPYAESAHGGISKKTIILLIAGIIVIIAIVGATILLFKIFNKAPATAEPLATQQPVSEQITTTPPSSSDDASTLTTDDATPTESVFIEDPVVGQVLSDADQDGLSDVEEIANGTDPMLPDTDNDGLTDREELNIYNTNPLNADSDGDGYLDGEEVQNGYNPNGSGRYIIIPQN